MNKNLVKEIAAQQLRTDLPDFRTGDTLRVLVRIIENGKIFLAVVKKRGKMHTAATGPSGLTARLHNAWIFSGLSSSFKLVKSIKAMAGWGFPDFPFIISGPKDKGNRS